MIQTVGTFLGGLGLFLLAVSMITDGVKIAAGNALRDILARSTRTPLKGILSGAFLTAMVQSSSAITIATIGFVNAGLLGIAQALGIVLGATVGTTMTGWLVALVGFQFKITSFALPLVGLGMVIRLLGPSRRIGALGEAVAGFGLFFIAVGFLREAFEGFVAVMDIASLSPDGPAGMLLFLGTGLLLTMLTQSSSAALAITLSALSGGLITFPAAAAAAIGATIGTTSTSALAAIGATANAKRVAAGHVIINSFNALIGLALLPLLIWFLNDRAFIFQSPALSLAAFHTAFNISGMLLLRPMIGRLAAFLDRRFISAGEELGRPQYLDSNVLASPVLAIDAFRLELTRMAQAARRHARTALASQGRATRELRQEHDGIRQLVARVEHFVATLETERLHRDVATQLPLVLRISNYIDEMVSLAQEKATDDGEAEYLMQTGLRHHIIDYQRGVLRLINLSDSSRADFSVEGLELEYQDLRERWRRLKSVMLDAGVRRTVPVLHLNPAIEDLRTILRIGERATRMAIRLAELESRRPPGQGKRQSEHSGSMGENVPVALPDLSGNERNGEGLENESYERRTRETEVG